MAYVKLAEIAPTTQVSSVVFSSIPQTYKHLELRIAYVAFGDAVGNLTLLQINGSTQPWWHSQRVDVNENGTFTGLRLRQENYGYPWVSSGIQYYTSVYMMHIANYSASGVKKNFLSQGGYATPNGSRTTFLSSCVADTTSAITEIRFEENGAGYRANQTIFTLYGLD